MHHFITKTKLFETIFSSNLSNKCKIKKTYLTERRFKKLTDLIKKAIYGDTDAFLELMDVNSLAMYKVAKGILGNDDDVADAVQNTILTCFEKLNTLKKPRYFKTWMIRILINECNKILSHYKKFNWDEEIPHRTNGYVYCRI